MQPRLTHVRCAASKPARTRHGRGHSGAATAQHAAPQAAVRACMRRNATQLPRSMVPWQRFRKMLPAAARVVPRSACRCCPTALRPAACGFAAASLAFSRGVAAALRPPVLAQAAALLAQPARAFGAVSAPRGRCWASGTPTVPGWQLRRRCAAQNRTGLSCRRAGVPAPAWQVVQAVEAVHHVGPLALPPPFFDAAMAAQGSQFRFNNGAPAEVSPRSLVGGLASGLANIGGGQPDVDALMSQYASAQNNDPEALVRALHAHSCTNAPARAHCAPAASSGRQRAGRQHAMRSAAACHGRRSARARKIGPCGVAQRTRRAAA